MGRSRRGMLSCSGDGKVEERYVVMFEAPKVVAPT
jgi:hypothetical protein